MTRALTPVRQAASIPCDGKGRTELEAGVVSAEAAAGRGVSRTVGRSAEVIRLHEETLADRERALGPDHPDTLKSRNNLASAYQEAGRTAEAIALHEKNLADRERLLGPDHPDTLRSRNNLANAYHAAGRTAEAIALLEKTLA